MTIKTKELWIGLVEVRPLEGCEVLEDAKGAFVNIVTWASNATEIKQKAKLMFENSVYSWLESKRRTC